MENLILSFTVVMPLFLMMILGYVLKRTHIFEGEVLNKINKAVFKIFLPVLIINNLYASEISNVFNVKLIIFSLCSVFAIFLLAFLTVPLLEKDNRKRGVLIQGIFRSNFVIFGVPLSLSLYNNDNLGTTAVMVAIIVPFFNFLAVIVLEIFRGGKPDIKKIIKGIITNPLILSSAAGIIILLSGIKFPGFIEKTVDDVSKIATPLGLIALGGAIDFSKIKGNVKDIFIGVFGKLIATPALILSAGIIMGFRAEELAILIAISASPVAVSSYTMAQQMGADDSLAAQLQMFGTVISIVTVFLWIFILKQFNFL